MCVIVCFMLNERLTQRYPKLFRGTVLLGAAIALSGCSENNTSTPVGDRGTHITQVILKNGVKCEVMDSPQGTALSCDWLHFSSSAPTKDPVGDRGTHVTLSTLEDGTQCAAMDSPQGTALSCN